jgi:hypothetical protein
MAAQQITSGSTNWRASLVALPYSSACINLERPFLYPSPALISVELRYIEYKPDDSNMLCKGTTREIAMS